MGIIAGLGRGMPSRGPPAGGADAALAAGAATGGAGATRARGRRTAAHALGGGERVVARARGAGTGRARAGLEAGAGARGGARRRSAVPRSVAGSAGASGAGSAAGPRARRGASGSAACRDRDAGPGRSGGLLAAAVRRPGPPPRRRARGRRRLGAGSRRCGSAGRGRLGGRLLGGLLGRLGLGLGERSAPYLSSNRFSTGGSTVELGAFTNSPRSPSILRTSLLGTSYFLASSWTRTLATCFLLVRAPEGCCGPLVDVLLIARTHCEVSHRRLMSWCSRSSWVLDGLASICVRGALATGRGSVLPGPRHHAAGPG